MVIELLCVCVCVCVETAPEMSVFKFFLKCLLKIRKNENKNHKGAPDNQQQAETASKKRKLTQDDEDLDEMEMIKRLKIAATQRKRRGGANSNCQQIGHTQNAVPMSRREQAQLNAMSKKNKTNNNSSIKSSNLESTTDAVIKAANLVVEQQFAQLKAQGLPIELHYDSNNGKASIGAAGQPPVAPPDAGLDVLNNGRDDMGMSVIFFFFNFLVSFNASISSTNYQHTDFA